MLKSIATARSEFTAKQENKARYNTYYIVPDLIELIVKLIKNLFIKIKRQLMLTNFTPVMYKIAEK